MVQKVCSLQLQQHAKQHIPQEIKKKGRGGLTLALQPRAFTNAKSTMKLSCYIHLLLAGGLHISDTMHISHTHIKHTALQLFCQ